MVRQLSVLDWCDLCLADGHHESATHAGLPIKVGSAPARTLDLCERHHKELVVPFLQLLDRYGVVPGREEEPARRNRNAARSIGPFKCLVPDCLASPLKHRGSLDAHLKAFHDMSTAEYIEQYGDLVPMDPADVEVVEAKCQIEWCGEVYSTAKGTRWPRAALVSHMRGVHALRLKRDGTLVPILPPTR